MLAICVRVQIRVFQSRLCILSVSGCSCFACDGGSNATARSDSTDSSSPERKSPLWLYFCAGEYVKLFLATILFTYRPRIPQSHGSIGRPYSVASAPISMLTRHAFLPTTRCLSRLSTRTFTNSSTKCLPRAKPEKEKKSSLKTPKAKAEPAKLQPIKSTKPVGKPIEKPQHLLSLLELQARLDRSLKSRTASEKGKATKRTNDLINGSKDHHDLESFIAFAERSKLSKESTVYRGTHYEYSVMKGLKPFGFHLHRTGKSNDKGIDLLGHWELPGEPHQIKVLIQCKISRATPATVRELAGAYAGAPSEWQGDNVLALIVSSKLTSGGVNEAVQQSPSPLGALQIEQDGLVKQFVWNAIAGERGLSGVGVTSRYTQRQSRAASAAKGVQQVMKSLSLTWHGKPFVPGSKTQ